MFTILSIAFTKLIIKDNLEGPIGAIWLSALISDLIALAIIMDTFK